MAWSNIEDNVWPVRMALATLIPVGPSAEQDMDSLSLWRTKTFTAFISPFPKPSSPSRFGVAWSPSCYVFAHFLLCV
jgi:hypothetical protein